MTARSLLALLLALTPAAAFAQERPSEDDLFGAPAEAPVAGAGQPQPEAVNADARPSEDDLFGGGEAAASPATPSGLAADPFARPSEDSLFPGDAAGGAFGRNEDALADPLKIGGQLYLRVQQSARQNEPPSAWQLQAPALVDGYFDARPNERVRGMVVGRLYFDPTIPAGGAATVPGFPGQDGGPRVSLDQLWIRFDLMRTVYVTAGRQHVRWGTARFWTPGDFLHPVRRDPLAVFDARLGTTMLKLHVPWEATGWNFYGVAMLENTDPVNRIGSVAGAARAEMVLGPAEIGLDAIVQKDTKPKFGFDISAGLGPFDVYAEAVLKKGHDGVRWKRLETTGPLTAPPFTEDAGLAEAWTPAATAGASWSFKYNDDDVATLGAEYFYNRAGYDDAALYPWLIFKGQFTPFYLGRHYGALFGMLQAPGSWNNTTFMLSTLGNLSDKSFISRLDYSVQVLTHLRLEAFGAAHYGAKGGEFRFGTEIPAGLAGTAEPIVIPAPTFELGLGVRVNI